MRKIAATFRQQRLAHFVYFPGLLDKGQFKIQGGFIVDKDGAAAIEVTIEKGAETVETYDLTVAGTKVTSANAADILGDGAFSYDLAENKLTVSGDCVTSADRAIDNYIPGLTIYVAKDSKLHPTSPAIMTSEDITITGPGKLTLESDDDCGIFAHHGATVTIEDASIDASGVWGIAGKPAGETLIIRNSSVHVAGSTDAICDFAAITLENCAITEPAGGWIQGGTIVDKDGNAVKVITIGKEAEKEFTVQFDAAGGTGTMGEVKVKSGEKYTLPACAFTAPEGKAFDQWDLGAPGTQVEIAEDTTIKALWKDAENTEETRVMPFTDVKEKDWFYSDVKTAYETYLVDGYTKTTYEPKKNLTYSQAVKLAACMHQRYTTGKVTLENAEKGKPWYETYVDYAKANGIITKDYDWNATATRAGYVEIFAHALPEEAFQVKTGNVVSDNAIPDVKMDHPQAADIYKLYRAGILEGSDGGKFKPGDPITRAEVAAILTRMMNESARKTVNLG